MTKKELLDDPNSCLNTAADDETLFVLRAQDMLAPLQVREWALKFLLANIDFQSSGYTDHSPMLVHVSPHVVRKFYRALGDADDMEKWPNRKLPD